jgi:hypothetical protein
VFIYNIDKITRNIQKLLEINKKNFDVTSELKPFIKGGPQQLNSRIFNFEKPAPVISITYTLDQGIGQI